MTLFDAIGVGAVLCAAVTMLLLLKLAGKFAPISPEWLRKLAHLGSGALAMSFPWLFSSPIPVFIVSALAVALLLGIRTLKPLRARLSGVLDTVERDSLGELYFPISAAILFALARGDKLLYVIPVLVLTFADAVAALLGTHYGKVGYHGMGGSKSLEGSVAFFTVAFFAVHVPLLLFTQMGRPQTLLVAIDIALIVTMLEAVAWRGLDNVFIPLGVFLLLHIYMAMPLKQLIYRLIVAVLVLAGVLLYRFRTTLEGSALLASALVLYAAWALGGWRWLLAPAVLFSAYTLYYPGRARDIERKHNVYPVTSVASAGLLWIFLANTLTKPSLLLPYTAGYAMHLIYLGWTLRYIRRPAPKPWSAGSRIVAQCWLLMFVPYILAQGFSAGVWLDAVTGLAFCAFAFVLFFLIEPRVDGDYSVRPIRWVRQGVMVLFLTALIAGVEELR
jgi:phytol kinase